MACFRKKTISHQFRHSKGYFPVILEDTFLERLLFLRFLIVLWGEARVIQYCSWSESLNSGGLFHGLAARVIRQ